MTQLDLCYWSSSEVRMGCLSWPAGSVASALEIGRHCWPEVDQGARASGVRLLSACKWSFSARILTACSGKARHSIAAHPSTPVAQCRISCCCHHFEDSPALVQPSDSRSCRIGLQTVGSREISADLLSGLRTCASESAPEVIEFVERNMHSFLWGRLPDGPYCCQTDPRIPAVGCLLKCPTVTSEALWCSMSTGTIPTSASNPCIDLHCPSLKKHLHMSKMHSWDACSVSAASPKS